MKNITELGISISDMQRPWPSTKRVDVMPIHRMQQREPVDSLTRAAMQEVSDALLNDRPTDRDGNVISAEKLDYIYGIAPLPTRAVIVSLQQPESQA